MTAGYRGKSTADAGMFYAPHIPETLVNWRAALDHYNRQHTFGQLIPEQKLNPGLTLVECATEFMQRRWPGAYVIEEYYNTTRGCFALRLKFQDPHEETLFMLKWS